MPSRSALVGDYGLATVGRVARGAITLPTSGDVMTEGEVFVVRANSADGLACRAP